MQCARAHAVVTCAPSMCAAQMQGYISPCTVSLEVTKPYDATHIPACLIDHALPQESGGAATYCCTRGGPKLKQGCYNTVKCWEQTLQLTRRELTGLRHMYT